MMALILALVPAPVATAPIDMPWADPIVLRPHLRLALRGSDASDLPVDAGDGEWRAGPTLSTLLRVGLHADTGRMSGWLNVAADLEYDIVDVRGDTDSTVPIDLAPDRAQRDQFLRTAAARVTLGPFVTVGGGFMTNHWGLGLVANDGAHGWTPGSAYFTDPRGGDRVLRGFVASGPWTQSDIMAFGAIDKVRDDDVLRAGDAANQALAAIRFGESGGFYAAHRAQDAVDGDRTEATVVDGYIDRTLRFDGWRLRLAAEVAWVTGETTLAPSADFETHDINQWGAVGRVAVEGTALGAVLDVVYASGDADAGDGVQNGFRADPNFDHGLLLFPYLVAATSGRAPYTAADPALVGYPAEDLDRLPTDGVVTNTFSVFPRFWGRPVKGVEMYGGALFAFGALPNADPLQSRLNGGDPSSAFGGASGNYLGTEVDLGLRYRVILGGTELVLGAEGGVFTPGDAFEDAEGRRRGAATGGRLLLRYTL